jgi:hypothetical protein
VFGSADTRAKTRSGVVAALARLTIDGMAALVPTLETLKAAVEAGELDAAMDAASAKIGKAFKK